MKLLVTFTDPCTGNTKEATFTESWYRNFPTVSDQIRMLQYVNKRANKLMLGGGGGHFHHFHQWQLVDED